MPQELLRQAERLVGLNAKAGRPRTVDLRSGVSRAYYAVFHEMTRRAAQMLVDGDIAGAPTDDALRTARWSAHTDVRALAEAVLGRAGPVPLKDLLASSHEDLVRACESFVTLQGLRHLADDEHSYDLDRRSARAVVRDADDALERLGSLRRGVDPTYARFLRLAGGSVRIAKTR
ncbi:hypothetical protein WDV85_14720 [Pseudokineococcus sp. 5B2Z-1]|uniref:hypothetical protein n=1 Tax=Pseudokineococcus sp. 5B2Z-1 TaxID=3132744 RepID=UPI0030960D02